MEDPILLTTPLRERGACPIPVDWVFKTSPRWKRREMIEHAYALDDARRRAATEHQQARIYEEAPLCADGLSARELEAAVKAKAAEILASKSFRGARSWVVPRTGMKQWTVTVDGPTRVHVSRDGATSAESLWPRQFCEELTRALQQAATRCQVKVRPDSRESELTIRLDARAGREDVGKPASKR